MNDNFEIEQNQLFFERLKKTKRNEPFMNIEPKKMKKAERAHL